MEILMIIVLIGLIPAAIAKSKGKSFVLWWFYGSALFIIALPHALIMKPDRAAVEQRVIEEEDRRKCPFCAELIKREATVCRYCSREVSPAGPAPTIAHGDDLTHG